jgi:hypothetical protein
MHAVHELKLVENVCVEISPVLTAVIILPAQAKQLL